MKKYFKPGLNKSRHDERNYIIPKSLSRKNFEEWMAGNKTAISDFLDYQIHIEILGDWTLLLKVFLQPLDNPPVLRAGYGRQRFNYCSVFIN